jgi:hypothetical protein
VQRTYVAIFPVASLGNNTCRQEINIELRKAAHAERSHRKAVSTFGKHRAGSQQFTENIVPTYINRNMDVSSICMLYQLCSKKASFVAEMGASVMRVNGPHITDFSTTPCDLN